MPTFSFDALSVDREIIDFLKSQKDIIIDKYSSKGGNGELFFGLNRILQKRVALKFYYIDDQKLAHEEVRILSNIKNANILEVFDAGVINKNYAYFLTPEIEGGDLDKFMQENRIEVFKAIHITKGILKGLTALHSPPNRLLHRDLKPSNILVDINRNPFIADFGSVRMIPSSVDSIKASCHTILFRPPEAFHNNQYYFKSDIYQVGIMLYQLIGGYLPYQDVAWLSNKEKQKYSLLKGSYDRSKYLDSIIGGKICSGKLLKYDSLPFFICKKLKSIIRKATNVDLGKRYQNTAEFMRDIHEFMSTSVNWRMDPEGVVAFKRNTFAFRIIQGGKKNISLVQKKCGKVWRNHNQIKGTAEEIAGQVNSL